MKHRTLKVLLTLLAFLLSTASAFARMPGYPQAGGPMRTADTAPTIPDDRNRQAERSSVMSVLKERIEDPEVLAKTGDKLFTLGDEELRLASSLCERISHGERTVQSDIVFSLVTALIVLS